ncbi:MAG: TonB-dependent receptor [Polaromonas sp.]|nr:TonB-dependent receptor [Polaromonas sp.]
MAAAFPASAQTVAPSVQAPQLKENMVTATRTEQAVGDVVADVTIVERDVIERAGPVGLADVLARVPGIEITRNGGSGSNSVVSIRGGENRQTAVLIDGVRIDSQTTSGGPSWASIPLAQIERIEIVRGPTSAIYGSDAVAGVIQIFTKRGDGPFAPVVAVEAGAYATRRIDVSGSGSVNAFDYSFGISEGASDGFNARPAPAATVLNLDADGYKTRSANTHLGLQINRDHRLEATVLQSINDAQYDGGTSTSAANLAAARRTDYRRISTLQVIGLQGLSKWTDRYSTRIAVSSSTDKGEENIGGAVDQTQIASVLFQNEYRIGSHLLTATFENRRDQFLLTSAPRVDRSKSQSGVSAGYSWSGSGHTLQLNMRNDRDSEFGGKTTGLAAYAYAITPQWRVSASGGTSYRVPTLYQRFSQYGVPNLRPESGRSNELGVKYRDGSTMAGIVAYRNRMTDLLTFLSGAQALGCPTPVLGCYSNTAQAEYTGVTLSGETRFDRLRVYGSLDLQNPRDLTQNKQLARRARQHAVLGADMQAGGWRYAADLLLSEKRFDTVANTTELPGYALVNLSVSTQLSRDWKFMAKLDNATDKDYQTAIGYAMARRALYLGVSWAPQ